MYGRANFDSLSPSIPIPAPDGFAARLLRYQKEPTLDAAKAANRASPAQTVAGTGAAAGSLMKTYVNESAVENPRSSAPVCPEARERLTAVVRIFREEESVPLRDATFSDPEDRDARVGRIGSESPKFSTQNQHSGQLRTYPHKACHTPL